MSLVKEATPSKVTALSRENVCYELHFLSRSTHFGISLPQYYDQLIIETII